MTNMIFMDTIIYTVYAIMYVLYTRCILEFCSTQRESRGSVWRGRRNASGTGG